MEPDDTYPMPKDGWVCFHCGERFKKYGTARDHFGEAPGKLLQCRAIRANLKRHQVVVEAARGYGRGEFGWPRRLEKALAALDATSEDQATSRAAATSGICSGKS